ncbi:2-isopropylmalate synthase A-like [Asparagus officinalis]|uniref:2-isopropylmalate synthase A-like n=1 Tax=Asparagus officinalis TaxID=4686 RepID=UPI00098E5018|nr:2-isopropylmalate synthase A-like [Asparagus officinalis]
MSSRPPYSPNFISDPSYVRILDTTLRDGEQAPGAAMTADQKLSIARPFFDLSVNIIAEGVGTLMQGHAPVIGAVARSNKRDIDAAWEAVKGALRPRLSTFIATSEIHMKHKLRMGREEVVARAVEMVAYARSLGCQDVTFAAEDAVRKPQRT